MGWRPALSGEPAARFDAPACKTFLGEFAEARLSRAALVLEPALD
jgi:hypothetical protein